jgi:hypothetical protein
MDDVERQRILDQAREILDATAHIETEAAARDSSAREWELPQPEPERRQRGLDTEPTDRSATIERGVAAERQHMAGLLAELVAQVQAEAADDLERAVQSLSGELTELRLTLGELRLGHSEREGRQGQGYRATSLADARPEIGLRSVADAVLDRVVAQLQHARHRGERDALGRCAADHGVDLGLLEDARLAVAVREGRRTHRSLLFRIDEGGETLCICAMVAPPLGRHSDRDHGGAGSENDQVAPTADRAPPLRVSGR